MKVQVVVFRTVALVAIAALLLTSTGTVYAQTGAIVGVVTAPGGGLPPAGVKVKLFQPGEWEVFGQADVQPDGSFSLTGIHHGLYVLKAVPPVASGFTQSIPVAVSIFHTLVDVGTIQLTDPQLLGTVTAPDGVTPVDAEIHVWMGDGTLLQVVPTPGGDIRIGGLPAGSYSLVANPITDDPYWHTLPAPVTVNNVTQTLTLTLEAADLFGVVTDHLGNPVREATVHAAKVNEPYHQHDLTSPTGYYAIGALTPGTYIIKAEPPWYEGALLPSQPVTVTVPPAPQALDLILGAPPKIVTGTVETNTGVAVTHAQVVAHRLDKGGRVETLSDPTGSYHLALSDGLWALTVKVVSTTVPSDWVFAEPPQLVHFEHTLAPEHKVENFTVITADAHVTGEVVMPGGGAPPFTVTISLHNDEGVGLYQIIEPGNTTFDVAVPNGGYKLWIRPDDTGTMGPVVEPFHVPPEETVDLGTLALLERNAVITGAITDESGTGIANVPVSAWRAGAIGGAETMTGPDGDYALSVVAGEWHVAPSPGPEHPYIFTGPAAGITLTATQTVTDVDFTLVTADATIVGFLVDENGQTLIDAGGWAQATHVLTPTLRNGAPIQAGTFSIAAPEGSFRVTANLPAGSPYMSTGERAVEIESGETVTITLQVKEKDARIIGSLWDPRNDDVVEGIDGRVLAWAGANWAQTRIDAGNGAFAMDIAAGVWHVGYHIDPRTGYVNLLHHKNVPVASEQTIPVALPIAKRDSAIEGIVLDAGGNPLGGVRVVVDGVGPVVDNIWLTTQTAADGHFHLTVPHGSYHLGAAAPFTDVIKPAQRRVMAPEGGVSGGHVLQFRTPDATISGDVAITGTTGITGPVSIWGWSDNDAFVFATVPVTHSTGAYTLDVISNTTWHLGAVFETPGQYWIAREMVSLGTGNATQDLVLTGPFPKPAPIAVTFDVMQPQQITLADGTHIFIPAGALPAEGQVTLHIAPIATLPHQRHANIYRYGYAFTAVDATGQPITEHFNQEVVIGFAYDERELRLGGIAEDRLKPAYFSTTTNLWTFPESYVVDAVANQVMMQIDHFTDFALTSQPSFSIFLPIVLVQ